MDSDPYQRSKMTVVRTRCKYIKEVKKEGEKSTFQDEEVVGTGVVFDSRGFVLTSAVCIPEEGLKNMEVSYFTSEFVTPLTGIFKEATVEKMDREHELAVLVPDQVCKVPYPAANFSANINLQVSQLVYSINHPLKMYYSGFLGKVSHLHRQVQSTEVDCFQISGLDTQYGILGGPVFDSEGDIISIICDSLGRQTLAVNPSIVRDFIQEFYKELKEKEEEKGKQVNAIVKKRKKEKAKKEKRKKRQQEFTKSKGVCSYSQSSLRVRRYGRVRIGIWSVKYWIALLAFFSHLFVLLARAALISTGQINVATGVAGYQDVTCHSNTLQFSGKGVSDSSFGGRGDGASTQVLGWPPIPLGGKGSRNGEPGPQFVKVNMDGMPIGRTVDLRAHACYETLAQTIKDMFNYRLTDTSIPTKFIRSNEHGSEGSTLSDGSSEQLLLTYEDKDGDWMLVGDVPWGIFLASVKRLRIRRALESYPYGP